MKYRESYGNSKITKDERIMTIKVFVDVENMTSETDNKSHKCTIIMSLKIKIYIRYGKDNKNITKLRVRRNISWRN